MFYVADAVGTGPVMNQSARRARRRRIPAAFPTQGEGRA
jgi:hypothetical protein